MNANISITKIIQSDIEKTKELIKEYLNWIDNDLSFRQVDEELAAFPEKYKEPDGSFFIAKDGIKIVGCVGMKKIQIGICEMKRLYVKDDYKGIGLGKELIKTLIEEATKKRYKKMRLDTLPKMGAAIKLYKDFGFYQIEQYVENPINGAIFMEKVLIDE